MIDQKSSDLKVAFYGGKWMALVPFLVFIVGVIAIALSGAPDEKGFWPILVLALGIGLLLSRNKKAYSESVLKGMSDPMVMIMITAWILASIIGILMAETGFVQALAWLASILNLGAVSFTIASFIICCVVSLSTGSSFATILICGPLLYPAGGALGGHLPTLAGAILAGATFGDFFAPISDTTIASALSQKAEIGPTVRSRIKYIMPASILALLCFIISAYLQEGSLTGEAIENHGSPQGLLMLIVPVLIIYLFLKGKHLFHGLMMGLLFGTALGIVSGLLPLKEILSLDLDNMVAQSFIIKGINRSIGLSIFTILLMGMVGTLTASGVFDDLISYAQDKATKPKHSEGWIAAMAGMAVLLTTHSIVAILMVSEFTNKVGQRWKIPPIRRSNILSVVVCIFPFLLPYFIPVILMSSMTGTALDQGIPPVSPIDVGFHNFLAWSLILVMIAMIFAGYGRKQDS